MHGKRPILAGVLAILAVGVAVALYPRRSSPPPASAASASMQGAQPPDSMPRDTTSGRSNPLASGDVGPASLSQVLTDARVPPERLFLDAAAVRGDMANAILHSDRFDAFMTRVERESDHEALSRAQRYRAAMADWLTRTAPQYAIERLACTRAACLVEARAPAPDTELLHQALEAAATATQQRYFALVSVARPHATLPGTATHRLLFTTDPKWNAIAMPPQTAVAPPRP